MKTKYLLSVAASMGTILAAETEMQKEGVNMKPNRTIEQIDIGVAEQDLSASVKILNTLLADEFVLLVQTLNYHWNLVGPQFHDYHLLFDRQYKDIFGYIDDIAERVRSVGGVALGDMQTIVKEASIQEDLTVPVPKLMIKRLLAQHEAIIKSLRKGINATAEGNRDMGTSNFLTDLIEKHEKAAWMLRSLAK